VGRPREARVAYQRAVTLNDADLKVNPSDALALASSAVFSPRLAMVLSGRRLSRALSLAPKATAFINARHRACIGGKS
jgi:hypothetical protein